MKFKLTDKCAICEKNIKIAYAPMDEWKINGNICSECYSERIGKHYPGKHIRTNRPDDFE